MLDLHHFCRLRDMLHTVGFDLTALFLHFKSSKRYERSELYRDSTFPHVNEKYNRVKIHVLDTKDRFKSFQ